MYDELYHWGFKRGEEKKNHKYVRRELIGTKNGQNKYRYFYDKVSGGIKAAKNSIDREMKEVKEKTKPQKKNVGLIIPIPLIPKATREKLKNKLVNALKNSKIVKDGEKEVHKQMTEDQRKNYATRAEVDLKEKEKQYKYIAKVMRPDGTFRYFYNKNELAAYYKQNGDSVEQTLMKRYGLKQEPDTSDNDQHVINEHFESGSTYYTNNCYSCAIASDIRRRGFDVEAIPDNDGLDGTSIVSCYKGGLDNTRYNGTALPPSYAKMLMYSDMKSQGDGARGIFIVTWKQGGGHAMSWEVKNNKVIIRDCQTNMVYDDQIVNRIFKYSTVDSYPQQIAWLRTDNLELDESVMKYVKKNE